MSENALRQGREGPWREYAKQYCDGALSAEGAAELERLLYDDPQAMESFVLYMVVHAQIAWNLGANLEHDGGAVCEGTVAGGGASLTIEDEHGWIENQSPSRPAPPASPPAISASSFILHPLHSSSACLPSFFSGVLWSYVCAALFLGMGIVAARFWGPAGDGRQPATLLPPLQTAAARARVVVGRITGTNQCRWLDPRAAGRDGELVVEGRTYVLNGGVLEISYDVGVKAILQGPAIYTVDASNGGSLILGKVTVRAAKVDRPAGRPAGRVERMVQGRVVVTRRLTPPPRAAGFCVVTRTAVVKNSDEQEAQFGVEVDRSWATYLHVLQGVVTIRTPGLEPQVVPPGTCAWTEAGANHNGLLVFRPGPKPGIFVTKMPKSPVYAAQPGMGENGRSAGPGG
jgi:hypothetical protein